MVNMVATVYIEKTNSQGKYTCYLLRETFREDDKVKHRTIANLSGCREEEIEAMRLALKHKRDLSQLVSVTEAVSLRQPRPSVKQLLKAASVRLPGVLPCKGVRVATRKKLPENRATP